MVRRFWIAGWMSAELQHDAIGVAPHQEAGHQPALGRAVAGQAGRARGQVFNGIGELAVQESGGIIASHADQAEAAGRGDDTGGAGCRLSVEGRKISGGHAGGPEWRMNWGGAVHGAFS
jgi:hypothetical protein